MLFKRFTVLALLAMQLISFSGLAGEHPPVSLDSVNFKQIRHKKIRDLIRHQKLCGIRTFNDIQPVCYNTSDSDYFRTFTKSQLIRKDIHTVWEGLVHQSPLKEFNGRIVSLDLLYSKSSNNLQYTNQNIEGIEVGQILFFNLRMLGGIKNIGVAMEVTRMDNDLKELEYCYVDHGNTRGTQSFTLRPTSSGFTEITQVTRYRCKSKLRNRRLYSFFHERIVKEFFASIKSRSEHIDMAHTESRQ